MPEIYQPAEDSFMLSKFLEEKILEFLKTNKEIKLLEIGSGSGIQLEIAYKRGIKKGNIFSCDINPKAVKYCKNLGFNCLRSDLFEKINGKFDVILFNPPYLPVEKQESNGSRVSTTGGDVGSEIINEFLKQAKKHLTKNGKIFLITSSLTKKINWLSYKKKIVMKEKLFFEEIFLWEIML